MTNPFGGNYANTSPQPQPPPSAPNPFLQQAQAQQQPNPFNVKPSFIPGKQVDSEKDITPGEVPMDGTVAIFYKKDFSCIYAKAWTDKGISTVKYIPEPNAVNQTLTDTDFQKEVMAKLRVIEKSVRRRNNSRRKDDGNESESNT